MKKEEMILKTQDGYELSLNVFESNKPKANIMFIHGMEEYKERYDAFASFLQENGYNVITSDLRGHGKNAPILSHIADKKGEELIIQDQKLIRSYMEERFPNLPNYLFGHSMGTIISRVLLQDSSQMFEKVALSGYVNPNGAAMVAVLLGKITKLFKGKKGHSKLLTTLAVGQFNKAIENPRTSLDWLSYNEENVDKYIADSLCGVEFSVASYLVLFKLLNKMGKAKKYHNVNKDMLCLLIAGHDDPCTGFDKGRANSKALMEKAGFKNIGVITYDNMRHEILNENNKKKVYQDLLDFFNE